MSETSGAPGGSSAAPSESLPAPTRRLPPLAEPVPSPAVMRSSENTPEPQPEGGAEGQTADAGGSDPVRKTKKTVVVRKVVKRKRTAAEGSSQAPPEPLPAERPAGDGDAPAPSSSSALSTASDANAASEESQDGPSSAVPSAFTSAAGATADGNTRRRASFVRQSSSSTIPVAAGFLPSIPLHHDSQIEADMRINDSDEERDDHLAAGGGSGGQPSQFSSGAGDRPTAVPAKVVSAVSERQPALIVEMSAGAGGLSSSKSHAGPSELIVIDGRSSRTKAEAEPTMFFRKMDQQKYEQTVLQHQETRSRQTKAILEDGAVSSAEFISFPRIMSSMNAFLISAVNLCSGLLAGFAVLSFYLTPSQYGTSAFLAIMQPIAYSLQQWYTGLLVGLVSLSLHLAFVFPAEARFRMVTVAVFFGISYILTIVSAPFMYSVEQWNRTNSASVMPTTAAVHSYGSIDVARAVFDLASFLIVCYDMSCIQSARFRDEDLRARQEESRRQVAAASVDRRAGHLV